MNTTLSIDAVRKATILVAQFNKLPYPHLVQRSVSNLFRVLRLFQETPPKEAVVHPVVIELNDELLGAGHPLAQQEISGCKALLLEIIRRAAYDWVLYRTSRRIQHKRLADDAYHWLFVEEPGHRYWVERQLSKKDITAFLTICESLELDPEMVRNHVRKLTVKNVMSVGRPAEYRRAMVPVATPSE